ncbi:MAG TPA: DUF3618 domain-containing protein [Jatrophihabitans sp.]|uniref:DUF3618 domain-containing protein n=1 Tax=Jatrophihabitans sp. TaxID=1932789 RepID=UPI002F1B82CA
MSNDPDQIRAEIEQTRANLSNDVNTLTDTVTPSNVAKRQVDKARAGVVGVKERVMGSAADLGSSASDKASNMTGTVADKASDMGSAVTGAPTTVKNRAAGNPLAAGLVAVGLGWLVGSLMPVSEREKQAATQAKDTVKETAAPVVTDAVKEVADNLKQPAQEAVESVKETAADAAQTVKEEGQASAQDVQGQAVDAKDTIKDSRS